MSEKEKAFALFDEGYRPSQVYNQVKVKHHTLYFYYQEWKKMQAAIGFEIEAEERDEELQQEAEEAQDRLQQEAEQQQEEVEQRVSRQQQEIKQLADKLHSVEITISQYQWFPDNLLTAWLRFDEINRAYSTPEEYLKALERRRDYLRSIIKERTPV